jgi:PAS domain S-box-containing protein
MEHEFSRVIDALPGLVWTAFPDGRADYVNRQWCDYTGVSRDAAIGTGWLSAVHPEDLEHILARWGSLLEIGRASCRERVYACV